MTALFAVSLKLFSRRNRLRSCAKVYAGFLMLAAATASCAHVAGDIPRQPPAENEAVLDATTVVDGLNENTYFALGNASLKIKRFKEAKGYFLKAIGLNPARPEFYNNLAWTYMEEGDYKRAEEHVKKAIALGAQSPYAYLDTYGVISMRMGAVQDAEERLLTALSLAPPEDKKAQAQILGHLLELYAKTGDKDSAKEIEQRLRGF